MPQRGSSALDLPVLAVFDTSDRPAPQFLRKSGPIIELAKGSRNLWAARLDEAVRLAERPVVVVAYGVSCFAVAWWARLSPSSYVDKVAGAVFVRPLGTGAIVSPEQRFDGPKTLLPCPSIVTDAVGEAATLARDWGSRFVGSIKSRSAGELISTLREELTGGRPGL